LYDGTNKRLSVLTGDNVGIKFSKIFPSASDTGILQLDFLPTQKYPQGGEFLLKLVQDDLNYYEIYNTDGYGPGMVSKVVNGQVITNEKFMSSYRQNTNYLVQVSFSPTKDVVQAFNDLVFLNTAPTSILVNSFSIELRQQRAYFDNFGYGNDLSDAYVSLGDSITKGSRDDIFSDGIGYPPILARLLTKLNLYPQIIFNEGISGHTTADGLLRLPSLLEKYQYSSTFLLQYGTNDAQIFMDSGLGLHAGDIGYEGSFKDNMQQIITQLVCAEKIPYLAKVPYATGDHAYLLPYIQEYNNVIDELASENNIAIAPPDFYGFFLDNQDKLEDGLHPNGAGYQSMAILWCETILGEGAGCN